MAKEAKSMNYIYLVGIAILLTACTYSITMVHSRGSTDVVDENQAASPDISPTVSIPAI